MYAWNASRAAYVSRKKHFFHFLSGATGPQLGVGGLQGCNQEGGGQGCNQEGGDRGAARSGDKGATRREVAGG
jgi:hypothetical protein